MVIDLEPGYIGRTDVADGGVPFLAERGGAAVTFHYPHIFHADLRVAGAVTLDLQIADRGGVAVVAVDSDHAADGAFDSHVIDVDVARAAVVGAVAAGAEQLAVLALGGEAALNVGGAVLRVVLEDLVGRAAGAAGAVECGAADDGESAALRQVGGRVLADIIPDDVLDDAVAALAVDAVGASGGGDVHILDRGIVQRKYRRLALTVARTAGADRYAAAIDRGVGEDRARHAGAAAAARRTAA